MIFGVLLNFLLFGFIYADILERRYPNEFNNCLLLLSYNIIYIYSKTHIFFIKLFKNINEIINKNPSLLKTKEGFQSFTKQYIQIIYDFIKDDKKYDTFESHNTQFGFALSYSLDTINNCLNTKLLYNKNEDKNEDNMVFEVSEIKFVLIEFYCGENNYVIDLKTSKFNFYIVGNEFTKQFFIYYLKEILKINQEFDNRINFTLKIIDNNVNYSTLEFTDKNESIILEKTSYKINNL